MQHGLALHRGKRHTDNMRRNRTGRFVDVKSHQGKPLYRLLPETPQMGKVCGKMPVSVLCRLPEARDTDDVFRAGAQSLLLSAALNNGNQCAALQDCGIDV